MEYKYKAFISYNHNPRDTKVAETLHRMIETYSIPRKLRDGGVKKPGKVFRDEEELSASSDLSGNIRDALDGSEFLIVICSPGAVASKWVSQEIAHFLENHAPERILTVLTDGNGAELYEKLLPGLPEPLSLDLTESSDARLHRDLKERFLKLCAPLLGCEYDDLFMRDQKRKRRQLLWWLAGITAVASLIIGILAWSNWQIEGKNRELERQNEEILLRESEILVNNAQDQLESGDSAAAIQMVLRALCGTDNDRPYYAPAEEMLIRALGFFKDGDQLPLISKALLEHVNPISDFCLSKDGTKAFIVDINSYVVCFDLNTGDVLWEQKGLLDFLVPPEDIYSSVYKESIQIGDKEILIAGDSLIIHDYKSAVISLSQETGEMCWKHQCALNEWGSVYTSENQNTIVYISQDKGIHYVEFVDVPTGNVLQSIPIADDTYWDTLDEVPVQHLRGYLAGINTAGALSSDGILFASCFAEEYVDGSTMLCYYIADQRTGICDVVCRQQINVNLGLFGAIIDFTDQDQTLTIFRTNGDESFAYTVEKYSLSDQQFLWSMSTPSDPDNQFSCFFSGPHLYLSDNIVLNAKNHLYILDGETGTMKAFEVLSASAINLFPVGRDSFAIMLETGEYIVKKITPDGLDTEMIRCSFSNIVQAECAQSGLVLSRDNECKENLADGFVATIPKDSAYHIELHWLVSLSGIHQNVNTGLTSEDMVFNKVSTAFPDEESILLGQSYVSNDHLKLGDSVYDMYSQYRFAMLDAESSQLRALVDIPFVNFDLCWLPDYNATLQFDDIGNLDFVNLVPEEHEVVSRNHKISTDETKSQQYGLLGYVSDVNFQSSDNLCVCAVCTEKGMVVWLSQEQNDILRGDFNYPHNFHASQIDQFTVGKNGYIGLIYNDRDSDDFNGCYFFDIMERTWYCYPYRAISIRNVWFANQLELVAFLNSDEEIVVMNIRDGTVACSIAFPLPYNSLKSIQFIMNDQYILTHTSGGLISIYSAFSGELVYTEWVSDLIDTEELHYAEDPVYHRLYIHKTTKFADYSSGSCIDTRTWTQIAEIPGYITYDARYNRIYRNVPNTGQIIACTLPGTEEIISIAKSLVG